MVPFSNYSHTGIVSCQMAQLKSQCDAPKKHYSKAFVTIPGYSYLHQHFGRLSIGIQNLTNKYAVIKPKATIAAISAAKVV